MTAAPTVDARFADEVERIRAQFGGTGRKTPPPVVPADDALTPELIAAVAAAGGRERCDRRLQELWDYRPAVRMAVFAAPPSRRAALLGVAGDELVRSDTPTVLIAPHLGDQKILPHHLRSIGRRVAQFDVERTAQSAADRWYRTLRVDAPGSALAAIAAVARGELLMWQPDAPLPDRTKHGVVVEMLGYRRRLNPTIAYIVKKTGAQVVVASSWLRDPATAGADISFRLVGDRDATRSCDPAELLATVCNDAAREIHDHVDQWRLWGFLGDERWSRDR